MMSQRYRRTISAPWRRAASQIHLSGVDGVRSGHPVEKQQAGTVIYLVLDCPCLERVRCDLYLTPTGQVPHDDQPAGALDVPGEVRNRHATLTGLLPLARLDHLGVAEHEGTVRDLRL